jgi:hypothetical protein
MNILFGCYDKSNPETKSNLLISTSKYGKYELLDKPSVYTKYGINQLFYIVNWNDSSIPDKTIDIIFLVHCPIYGIFFTDKYKSKSKSKFQSYDSNNPNNPFNMIAKETMRLLKKGGRLIIPTYSLHGRNHDIYIPIESQISKLQRVFKKYMVYHTTTLPIYFKSSDDGEMRGNYLIVDNTSRKQYLSKRKTKKIKK